MSVERRRPSRRTRLEDPLVTYIVCLMGSFAGGAMVTLLLYMVTRGIW